MKQLLLLLLISGFIFQSCESGSIEKEKKPESFTTVAKGAQVVKANNNFAFNLFKEIVMIEEKDNFMISPVSASLALNMVYNGAENQTKEAFANMFDYGNATIEETNAVNKNMIAHLTYSGYGSTFNIANSLWIRNSFPVKEGFINVNKEFYDAEVYNMDFSDPKAKDIINNWCSDKTNGKIPEVIKSISDDMVMYAINALYFNANWKYEFKKEDTKELPFYDESGTAKNVAMMSMEQTLNTYSNETFTSVVLPYKDDAYNMTLLLPNQDKKVSDVVAILNQENWNDWQTKYYQKNIQLTMPKFKASYEKLFNKPLMNLGLDIAFSGGADFSNLTEVPVQISFVLQKTFIDVNEVGTEAAAVTVVGIETTSAGGNSIVFNKPFLYVITNKETGAICFMGKVGMPEYK